MLLKHIAFGCSIVLGLLAPLTGQAQVSSATIKVNLQEQKAPVSPGINGIFMEEISHAFDGGIYAELIQNRSFEEGLIPAGMKLVTNSEGILKMELESLPDGVPTNRWEMPWPWGNNCVWDTNRALIGWSLLNEGGAIGEMKLTEANPMNAASKRSLAMTIAPSDKPESRVALVNSGYWGINVQSGVSYDLKFYLRPGTFKGKLTASLETEVGKVLASHDFGTIKPGSKWKKLTTKMKASGSDAHARFVLSFRGQGDLQVDWVSLFPPTYKNRPNGLRPDLVKYLTDLKPAFIRYPGGCYVEGFSWQSAPDWRTMVCPPEERPGTWSYWQYRSTDGFGYHEYLQFCEDIGADALYVSFAGMTVHPDNNLPLDKIDPVLQQTLDAIEYAIGPVSSKWGAKRAKMGHPKPFPLKYVEIGNEHHVAIYGDYYKKFRAAIKAKYPEMPVIMSMFWSGLNPPAIARAGDTNIDIVDEHAYNGAGWIRSNFDYFDRYPRKNWKIYIGEYASQSRPNGNWYGGLSDSVYQMMLERNGDLVTMASYAPLFCNVNKRDWAWNLIEFDSSRSFAHGSYYVQKLFAETRPDVNLATQTDVEPKPDPTQPLMAGSFGLGSWDTQNEFKELRIYDQNDNLVFSDDFTNLDNWVTPGNGNWQVEGGVLKQTATGEFPARLFLKNFKLETGRVTLKARRVGGAEGFLTLFSSGEPDQFLFCNYGGNGNRLAAIQEHGVPEGRAFRPGRSSDVEIKNDRWYDISLVVKRDRAEMLLDGKSVSTVGMKSMPAFFATAGYDRTNRTIVIRATSYSHTPVRTEVQIAGARKIAATGKHVVIAASSPNAENSLENPMLISPKETPLTNVSDKFSVELPPFSVNVFTIPATPE